MKFNSTTAQEAYDKLKSVAEDCRADVVKEMQREIDAGAAMSDIAFVVLNNSKQFFDNMARAIELANELDREERSLEVAIHNAYNTNTH